MPTFTLTALVPWVIAHGYFIFFIIAVIEGTLITVAAGIAAGLGHFNIIIIILIAIAGDLTADVVYYFLGYHSRILILERYGHHFGITKERIEKIGTMVHQHFKKTMLVVKLSPFIPVPGLIAIGASHIPIRKFIGMSLLITAPKSIFFALLGFYSGKTYIYLSNSITNGTYIVGGIILFIAVIYLVYQKITSKITKDAGVE
ncbi:MAG: VTT domain-containing protein [Candidatus Paceibacterota bacterium]|jgi:membrane protein DedA with SNARE-associated domain